MSEERSKVGVLIAVTCWVLIAAAVAYAAKTWILPMFRKKERQQITEQTSSGGKYRSEIKLAADAFSGYALLRSPAMADRLRQKGIRLTMVDDKANYSDRIRNLRDGEVQAAVFTVDSFIKAGGELGEFPGSIVYVLDETKGADAVLTLTNSVSNINDLNSRDARFVYTSDSPSEFLARIVVASFSLPKLPEKFGISANGAEEVFKKFKAAKPGEKHAYVMWEPYVSRARDLPGAMVLVDSSKLKGYIVDVLVCRREFLVENYDAARALVEAYARAAFMFNTDRQKLVDLVIEDARATGSEKLDKTAAEQIVRGIQWKNTVENYIHFGLLTGTQSGGIEHLEDVIAKITAVLVKTGALKDNPVKGAANTIFYDKILRDMKADSFHPGKELNLLGTGDGSDAEQARGDKELAALKDEEWNSLVPVGELRAEPISFARGTANINMAGDREISTLARNLLSWPQYYLMVVGQARPEGDLEANKQLAQARADAVVKVLTANRIDSKRIRTKAIVSAEGSGDAQSVVFVVCQKPF